MTVDPLTQSQLCRTTLSRELLIVSGFSSL